MALLLREPAHGRDPSFQRGRDAAAADGTLAPLGAVSPCGDQAAALRSRLLGRGGIDRIHAEAAGWPHLVQLLAEGVVQLVNLRGLSAATPALLEEAIATAAVRGDAVLRQLVRNECRLAGERDYLARFRTHDLQCRAGAPTVRLPAHRRCMVQRRCERCSADDRSRPARHGGRGRRGRACPVSAAFRNFTQEARFNRRHAEGG
jgi:hypothetical protein